MPDARASRLTAMGQSPVLHFLGCLLKPKMPNALCLKSKASLQAPVVRGKSDGSWGRLRCKAILGRKVV